MSAEQQLALKGPVVEEWLDLRFFRPLGIRIARAVLPTRVTPSQITLASLVVGLVAAHLLYYEGWAVNLTAFVLIVVADLLDSADGQLARLRGGGSRAGRMFDGFVDNVRWIAVYFHLAFRALAAGHGYWVLGVAAAAGAVHSLHSTVVDMLTFGYLELGEGRRAVDLPEDVGEAPAGWFWRHAWPFYRGFVSNEARIFRGTFSTVRLARLVPPSAEARARYGAGARPAFALLPLIGQNCHIIALGVFGMMGMPLAYFAWSGIGVTAVAVVIVVTLERASARLRVELDVEREVAVGDARKAA
jgi:hypothetical protein